MTFPNSRTFDRFWLKTRGAAALRYVSSTVGEKWLKMSRKVLETPAFSIVIKIIDKILYSQKSFSRVQGNLFSHFFVKYKTLEFNIRILSEKNWQGYQNCILSVQRNILGKNHFFEKNMFFVLFSVCEQKKFSMDVKSAFYLSKGTFRKKWGQTWSADCKSYVKVCLFYAIMHRKKSAYWKNYFPFSIYCDRKLWYNTTENTKRHSSTALFCFNQFRIEVLKMDRHQLTYSRTFFITKTQRKWKP